MEKITADQKRKRRKLSALPELLDSPAGVYVSGNRAYVTSQNSNALEIVDVSIPTAPTHRVSLTNGTGGALYLIPGASKYSETMLILQVLIVMLSR